jgi:dissimilatory sulfite reductase (desulfoviridin) alpha/beta subunit
MLTGVAYYFLTQDTPRGDLVDLRAAGLLPPAHTLGGTFGLAARDPRVWALFVVYGACFGVELTMDNIAALYYKDYFGLSLKTAGLAAGSLGMLHIFARSLGGYMSDRIGSRWGLKGRVNCLFAVLLAEGLLLMFFSRMTVITLAIPTMLLFGLFMKMSEGATYAVVPFINKKALGSVAGIIGAGGNAGAVAAGFLFKAESISWPTALLILGMVVSAMSFLALTVRFSHAVENEASSAHVGFHPQRQPGFSYLGVALPVGRMSCKQMEGLADIADRLGDGLIRLTVWQNLLIPGIAEVDVDEVKRAIEQLGFEWDASSFRSGLIACTGNAGCKFSASDTKRRAMILARHLEERLTLDRPINIHVTGCRNSCAQHYIGDIGLEGTKVEVGEELVEGYHLCVGGGWGLEQGIGRRLIESLPLDEIPPIVERLLLHYLDGREGPAESFAAFVRRHTIEELRCVVRYEPAGR